MTLAQPIRGDLTVYWLLPSEAQQDPKDPSRWWVKSMRAARNLLSRAQPFPQVDFARTGRVAFRTAGAPADAIFFALVDTHRQTFNTLLDGARAGDWFGAARRGAHGEVAIALAPVAAAPPRHEQCSGPRDELRVLSAPEVAGSVGNDPARRLCVHLPASYAADRARRYPVVFVLPGFSGQDSGGSVGLVFRAADELPVEREAIFIGVNIATKIGASYLVASPLSGDFDTFLSKTVLNYIDREYRTVARRDARGLIGQSTGGFDVVSFALRHSELFGAVAESSADGLDLGSWMLAPDGRHLTPFALDLLRLEDAFGPPGQLASYAADWTPDATARWGFRWPADPKTGEVVLDVWRKWLAQSPSELIKDPAILSAARRLLSGKIYLTAGTHDDFDLYQPAELFSRELTAAGIENQFVSDEEDHGGTIARKRRLVQFMAEHLVR